MNRFTESPLAASALHAGWLAGAVFAVALLALGAVTPGYTHAQHVVSLLGADGMAYASAWNALGFVLPGLLVVVFAYALFVAMQRDGMGFAGRIGLWLLLFSGLAFAGNGVFAYDLQQPDARAAQLHVAMLTLTLLAFLPGVLLLALGARRRHGWRVLVWIGPLIALAMVINVMQLPGEFVPALKASPGYAQRLTLALYFGWFAVAAWMALRHCRARAPQPSP